jgi:type IV pilus assembly protein PilO
MKTDFFPMAALEQKVVDFSSTQKVLIFLFTFLVLCGGFYYLQYKPQAEKIQGLKREIDTQEKRLVELKKAAAQVQVLEAEIAKSQEEFNQMLALLPDQKEIPGLLDSVSRLASQAGLENVFFQPQPEQPQDFYAVIPVRLDLVGTYHQLATFFDTVSKLERIVKVDNLSLTRQKDSSRLVTSCTIMTYRFVEQDEPRADAKGDAKKAAPKAAPKGK